MNRFLAGAALGGFLVAMLAIVITSASGNKSGTTRTVTTTTTSVTVTTHPTTTTAPTPPGQVAVKLVGTGAYDPEGDSHENDDLAPLAVDGDAATFWKTEHYNNGFFKQGVGLVLDAGKSLGLSRVVVVTDQRGPAAQIEIGTRPAGPFRVVSKNRPLTGTTTFTLNKGAAGRYIVVWITAIPKDLGEAHVAEVRAVSTLSG